MNAFKIALYVVAVGSCLACTFLLFRAYTRQRLRLLLWSALCFVCLTVSNMVLFADLVLFPEIDLRMARLVSALVGMLFLLHAFIWESE